MKAVVLNGERYSPPLNLTDLPAHHSKNIYVDMTIPLTDGLEFEMVDSSLDDLLTWSCRMVAERKLSEEAFSSISKIYVQLSQKYNDQSFKDTLALFDAPATKVGTE